MTRIFCSDYKYLGCKFKVIELFVITQSAFLVKD